jgi:hypothetical protein
MHRLDANHRKQGDEGQPDQKNPQSHVFIRHRRTVKRIISILTAHDNKLCFHFYLTQSRRAHKEIEY